MPSVAEATCWRCKTGSLLVEHSIDGDEVVCLSCGWRGPVRGSAQRRTNEGKETPMTTAQLPAPVQPPAKPSTLPAWSRDSAPTDPVKVPARSEPLAGFQVFHGGRRTRHTEVGATIGKSGNLRLTPAAMDVIGDPAHVRLLFNPERRQIGIQPATEKDASAVPIYREEGGRPTRRISIRSFCTHFNIALGRSHWIAGKGVGSVLVLELEPTKEAASVRP